MKSNARLCSLALSACLAGCIAPDVWVTPRYGQWGLDGSIAAVDSSTGTLVEGGSTTDDLGLTEDDERFGGRVDVKWLGGRATGSYQDAAFSGTGTLQADVTLDGQTIAEDTEVDTDVELEILSGTVTWDVIPTDFLDVALGFGGGEIAIDATIVDNASSTTLTTDESTPYLTPALFVSGEIGPVLVSGLATLMDTEWLDLDDDFEARFFDLDVSGSLRILDGQAVRGYVTLGYRLMDVEAEYEDDSSDVDADFELSGPYIGVTLAI